MPNPVGYPATVAEMRQLIKDFGTCLSFDGNNDQITIGTSNPFTGNFYFAAWVKWYGSTGGYQHLFAKRDSYGPTTMMFDLHLNNTTSLLALDTNVASANFAYLFPKYQWVYLVWVHNVTDSLEQIYINADRVYNNTIKTLGSGTTALNTIGAIEATPTEGFNGRMDEIVIGQSAPTWAEVVAMYAKYNYPSKWTYFKLDEGSGSSATDSSGNSNTGSISGASYVTDKIMTTRTVISQARKRVGDQTSITDTFTRADSASSMGETEAGNATWQTNGAVWGISSNKAYRVSGSGIVLVNAGVNDVDVSVTIDTYDGVTNEMGIYFRALLNGTAWMRIIRSGTSFILQKRVSGTTTTIINLVGQTFANGDVFRVVASDSIIRCYLNGVLKISVSNPHNFNNTYHGFGYGTTQTAGRFDGFTLVSPHAGESRPPV